MRYGERTLLDGVDCRAAAGGVLPVAWGETPLAAFGVQAQVSYPPDPVLPAELGVNARFVPADGVGDLGV